MKKAALVLTCVLALGCSSNQKQGAAKGGTTGAVAGAAAGAVSALIFGGNVGEAAAKGAVWAGTAGAVSGSIAGTEQDRREAEAQQAEAERKLRQLREKIGQDAFEGLGALADCKHAVALAYADTGATSNNPDFATASVWLRAITYLDSGQEDRAHALYPELVERDERTDTVEKAHEQAMVVLETVHDFREKYDRPRTCQ
jgi:uncharacterized protein YcfJ